MRRRLGNPFAYYPAGQLIGIGTVAFLVGSLIGWCGAARYDGVFDLYFGPGVAIWQPLLDNLINSCSLLVPLFIFGISINRKTRFVDILSAVLVARIPYYVLPLFNVSGFVYQSGDKLVANALNGSSIDGGTIVVTVVFLSFAIAATALFIIWLFRGFQIATNCKTTGQRWVFAGCILLAEIISKLCILFLSY